MVDIVIRFKINISKTTSRETILDTLKFDIIKINQTKREVHTLNVNL